MGLLAWIHTHSRFSRLGGTASGSRREGQPGPPGSPGSMAWRGLATEFLQVPAVTRTYTAACVLTTAAVQLELLSPFQLYFNPHLVFRKFQAPFLPWALMGFSMLLGNSILVDLLGPPRPWSCPLPGQSWSHPGLAICAGHWALWSPRAGSGLWRVASAAGGSPQGSLWATSTTSWRMSSPTSQEARGCC
ncbi:derlin-3 isoform X11 [Camelus dromedarius]|uniref:derlin-3 isoform X11 n=1 Tax=Camelus dromedarius TaxID=9838 RepID=UPI0031195849